MGTLDEDGYFKLTGRNSYYIRSDLNKVYLGHIQSFVSLIDVVEACCVVPKPDKDLLFTNKAYVVLKDGIMPTKEVRETIQLKPYEVPESIEFLDKLPLTKADKVNYALLEEMAKEEANTKLKKKELK